MKRMAIILSFFVLMGCMVTEEDSHSVKNHRSKDRVELSLQVPAVKVINLVDERDNSRVSITLNDYGYKPDGSLDVEKVEQLAKQLALEIDTPMRNPSINESGEVTPGQERIILSESELVETLLHLPYYVREVSLPIYVTEPTVSKEQLIGLDKFLLAEYKTFFNSSVEGRTKNIKLSAEAIHDLVLGPGDDFSFNRVVGERTIERGYQEAKEIVNKEFVIGIGGGICQTSSTLFNAVEAAGLEMIERYTHSREVGYVPEGRDATVSWGGPDFRFRNTLQYPIMIRTQVTDGALTVKVFSHKESS
ncbi:VanW family protein [Halalkalibacter urbisdiaboli]|uniref:VanW family protein n=1 Tax=Halalkalibacter urbisdiaboli TaxID=1960589 RepID=UPI000B44CD6E|nr:VanW family protein [Halalkalibacter urbisdiaboli]